MKITSYTDKFPYLYIENVYTDEEIKLIFSEFDYYQSNKTILESNTRPATDIDGNSKARKKGIFLDSVFQNRDHSNILCINQKLYKRGLICERYDNYFFRHFSPTEDFTLFSYYENGDAYKPHVDECIVSICIWLWKEPKRFNGGDFCFPDFDIRLKVQNNHAVVFPSSILHSVDKIEMLPEYLNQGFGRYSICNFLNYRK